MNNYDAKKEYFKNIGFVKTNPVTGVQEIFMKKERRKFYPGYIYMNIELLSEISDIIPKSSYMILAFLFKEMDKNNVWTGDLKYIAKEIKVDEKYIYTALKKLKSLNAVKKDGKRFMINPLIAYNDNFNKFEQIYGQYENFGIPNYARKLTNKLQEKDNE